MKQKRTKATKQKGKPAKRNAAPRAKAIAPLVRVGGAWEIDASEYTPDAPLWGPYETRGEAEEDRRGLVRRIEKQRKAEERRSQAAMNH